MFSRTIALAAAATLAASAGASVFSDGFETYPAGSSLHGVNGWKGWDNKAVHGANVSSARAYEGAHSVHITGSADLVQQFAGVTSGKWSLTARHFVEADAKGVSYFILMNKYADNANTNWHSWSVQMKLDFNNNVVFDDLRRTSTRQALVRGEWVEIRADIDLINNTLTEYYNGNVVFSGAWKQGKNSALALAAIDLYAGTGSSFYDNIALAQIPAPGAAALMFLGALTAAGRDRNTRRR